MPYMEQNPSAESTLTPIFDGVHVAWALFFYFSISFIFVYFVYKTIHHLFTQKSLLHFFFFNSFIHIGYQHYKIWYCLKNYYFRENLYANIIHYCFPDICPLLLSWNSIHCYHLYIFWNIHLLFLFIPNSENRDWKMFISVIPLSMPHWTKKFLPKQS